MIGIIFGALVALLFTFLSLSSGIVEYEASSISLIIAGTGTIFLFLGILITLLAWPSLQRTEEKSFPRVQEMFFKDFTFHLYFLGLFIYAIYSYFSVLILATNGVLNFTIFLILWIFLTGCAFDVLRAYLSRILHYNHDVFLLERMTIEYKKIVKSGDEQSAMEWIDTAFEVVIKSIKGGKIHAARTTLLEIFNMMEDFVVSASAREALKFMPEGDSLLDRVNYLTVHITKRMEWVFNYALHDRMNSVCEEVITICAKISRYLVKCQPSLTHLPLLVIERCAEEAEKKNIDEMYERATATISELVKFFVTYSLENGESLRDPIISALLHLEEIVKVHFKKHQGINSAFLMQPFAEIAQLLGDERFVNLPDREDILKFLKRIFAELNAVDLIMKKGSPDISG